MRRESEIISGATRNNTSLNIVGYYFINPLNCNTESKGKANCNPAEREFEFSVLIQNEN